MASISVFFFKNHGVYITLQQANIKLEHPIILVQIDLLFNIAMDLFSMDGYKVIALNVFASFYNRSLIFLIISITLPSIDNCHCFCY